MSRRDHHERTTPRPRAQAEAAVQSAARLALEHLERERDLPRRAEPAALLTALDLALRREGRTLDEVTDSLSRLLAATTSTASPRFVNQLFGGRDPAATLAEMVTPLVNTSMYTFKAAGPQVLIEREVLQRMGHKVGFTDGEGIFAPGGSLANLTAMIVARNEAVPAARDHGLDGQALTVYTSIAGHYSIPKNAGFLGIGRNNVRHIPTDGDGRMDPAALRQTIARDLASGCTPVMINATAGTTVLGAFDPIEEIAGIAEELGIWLHVDGAFGGTLLLSREHRHLLAGCQRADSFTWDAHKMMGVPLTCSAVLLRRSGLLGKHLNESADYLFQADSDRDNPGTRSIQCGRRNDALKLWAAWQLHGDAGYEARVHRQFELAQQAVEIIEADDDLILSRQPQSINVCFEVRARSSRAICDLLDQRGRLKIGHGIVNGRRAIRLVCVNPDLTDADLETLFAEIKAASAELPMGDNALG